MSFFVVKTPQKVVNDIVMYKKETKKKDYIFENIIIGLPSRSKYIPLDLQTNTNVIYKGLTHSKFSIEPTKIFKGYKKIEDINKDWILSVYLNPYISPEKITKLNTKGVELTQWIEKYKDKWLTIQQVKELPLNKKIKLLLLDRNIYDNKDHIKEAKLYSPTFFFKKNYAWYWKTDNNNLIGKIKYEWQKETDEPYDFEFHIEYKEDKWYPLTNGILPKNDEQKIVTLLNKDIPIKDFSPDTHIGYRGPIIIWKEIKNFMKVYL
jgi:hypothetical protein